MFFVLDINNGFTCDSMVDRVCHGDMHTILRTWADDVLGRLVGLGLSTRCSKHTVWPDKGQMYEEAGGVFLDFEKSSVRCHGVNNILIPL